MLVSFLFLLGCVTSPDHMGCQEGEIVDGECVVAEEKNADLFATLDSLDVISEEVSYMEGVTGYLAQPSAEGNYPGVIMIHEWWGLNDNVKDMANLLANEGYVVLAVDIYEGEIAEDSGKAGKLAGAARANPEKAVYNMQQAALYLRSELGVQKLGSMGWCFGGGQSLQLALSGEELDATVIYYGHLVTEEEQLSKISWPVLGIFGEKDTSIPVSSVNEFEGSLNSLEIQNEIHIYPGVGHAFANPSGTKYAPDETKDAWEKTVVFLDEHLK